MKPLILLFILIFSISGCKEEDPVSTASPGSNTPDREVSGILAIEKYGESLVVYSNPSLSILKAFFPETRSGENVDLAFVEGSFPVIMNDETGSRWNVFGECISGPRVGEYLEEPDQMVGYWFAISSMFAQVTLLEDESLRALRPDNGSGEWLVDPSFVFAGAPKNAIPAIRLPEFSYMIKPQDFIIEYLEDDERVAVINRGDSLLVLPIPILNWHEVVNVDPVAGGTVYSYCPLTGTSVFNQLPEEVENIGVSGLLYNNNLIMFDKSTNSHWSQITSQAINGPLSGEVLEKLEVTEMTWKGAKLVASAMYILDARETFNRDYNVYPYGDYETNHNKLTFSIDFRDERLLSKERVLAIELPNGVLAIRNSDFN